MDGRLAEKVSVFNKCLPGRSGILAGAACGTGANFQPHHQQPLGAIQGNSGRASKLARQRSLENVHAEGRNLHDKEMMNQTIGGSIVKGSQFSKTIGNPMIIRQDSKPASGRQKHHQTMSKTSSHGYHQQTLSGRPGSAAKDQAKQYGDALSPQGKQLPDKYGRRVYDNSRNNPSSGAHRATFNSYSQVYGTITEQALAQLHAGQVKK